MTNSQKLLMIGGAPWLTRRDYPKLVGGLEAWFDETDPSSMIMDSANRVSLISDKSGNSSTNVLCLNGVAGNYASIPDAANLSGFTVGITMTVRVMLPDYTPAANMVFIAKDDTTTREYAMRILTTGEVGAWANSAGTFVEKNSTGAALTDFGT